MILLQLKQLIYDSNLKNLGGIHNGEKTGCMV